jgi:hypothetical protein
MGRDWIEWHEHYENPESSISKRLVFVLEYVRRALDEQSGNRSGAVRLVSVCAGEGRDVLPLLFGRDVRATLVELDPVLAGRASATAAALGLSDVDIRIADAGDMATLRDVVPAHIFLAAGVFGNVPDADVQRFVAALPGLLEPGGIVIWTRGRGDGGTDPTVDVLKYFAAGGFTELAFTGPDDDRYRVGMHRLTGPTGEMPAGRLFTLG